MFTKAATETERTAESYRGPPRLRDSWALDVYEARFPFKRNRLRCVRCVNEKFREHWLKNVAVDVSTQTDRQTDTYIQRHTTTDLIICPMLWYGIKMYFIKSQSMRLSVWSVGHILLFIWIYGSLSLHLKPRLHQATCCGQHVAWCKRGLRNARSLYRVTACSATLQVGSIHASLWAANCPS